MERYDIDVSQPLTKPSVRLTLLKRSSAPGYIVAVNGVNAFTIQEGYGDTTLVELAEDSKIVNRNRIDLKLGTECTYS